MQDSIKALTFEDPAPCLAPRSLVSYKPQPETYLTTAALLGLKPEECMMVGSATGLLIAAADGSSQEARRNVHTGMRIAREPLA